MSDLHLFKNAFDQVKEDRHFVPIHKVRNLLNWDYQRFDKVLSNLAKEGYVYLSGGDPGLLDEVEIKNSYFDHKNRLRLVMQWVKELTEQNLSVENNSKPLGLKAVGYLRVSSQGQVSGHGYARQEEKIRRFSKQNRFNLVKLFFEDISGTKGEDSREIFQEMVGYPKTVCLF